MTTVGPLPAADAGSALERDISMLGVFEKIVWGLSILVILACGAWVLVAGLPSTTPFIAMNSRQVNSLNDLKLSAEAKKAVEGQRKGVDKTKEGEVKPRELKQRQPKPIVYAIDRNLEKRLGNLNDCMAELDFASSTVNDDGTLKVHDIQQGSLLEKVGLQENDVLERVGGKVIDFNSFQECHNAWQESLQKLRSGTPIVVEIKRKGKLQQLIVAPDF